MKRKFLKMAGLTTLGLAVLSPSAFAAEFEFKLHHFLPGKSLAHVNMLEPWAKAVEKNSNGRVKINIYPSMSLGGRPPELAGQVRDGVVDLVWTVNGYTPGVYVKSEVFELPGIHQNSMAATNLALHDMFETHLKDEYKGIEVMYLHVHAGQAFQMRKGHKIRTPADLAGKKIRIPSRTGAWVISALGATPIATSIPQLSSSLQKGVVDGAMVPFELIPAIKLQNQTQYQIEGYKGKRFGTSVFQVSMNGKRWNSLPADIQKAFRDASGRNWLKEVAKIWDNGEAIGKKMAVNGGNTYIELTKSETDAIDKKLEAVTDRWVNEVKSKNVDGRKLVKIAQDAVAKNSK